MTARMLLKRTAGTTARPGMRSPPAVLGAVGTAATAEATTGARAEVMEGAAARAVETMEPTGPRAAEVRGLRGLRTAEGGVSSGLSVSKGRVSTGLKVSVGRASSGLRVSHGRMSTGLTGVGVMNSTGLRAVGEGAVGGRAVGKREGKEAGLAEARRAVIARGMRVVRCMVVGEVFLDWDVLVLMTDSNVSWLLAFEENTMSGYGRKTRWPASCSSGTWLFISSQ